MIEIENVSKSSTENRSEEVLKNKKNMEQVSIHYEKICKDTEIIEPLVTKHYESTPMESNYNILIHETYETDNLTLPKTEDIASGNIENQEEVSSKYEYRPEVICVKNEITEELIIKDESDFIKIEIQENTESEQLFDNNLYYSTEDESTAGPWTVNKDVHKMATTCEDIGSAVCNGQDIVHYLLRHKFSALNFDDKMFVLKLKPTPRMKNLVDSKQRGNNRSFNMDWYEKYKWLTGSEVNNKLYCWHCLLFFDKPKGSTPWNSTGYSDLKHLSGSLLRHSKSEQHTYSSLKFKLFGRQNVECSSSTAYRQNIVRHNEAVKENREIIRRFIDIILHLAMQEQAFRELNETEDSLNQGNFKELVTLLAKYDSKFKIFLDESSVFCGTSKTIQNEIINSINSVVNEHISNEIKESVCFSWQVDETTDIRCFSQLSVIFRYVKDGTVVERFMGFFDASKGRKASDLFHLLTHKFNCFDIENKLIGQTYDGASVMSGDLTCLQALMKSVAPQAIFIHYYAHRLNLILQDASNKIKECRIFFANLSGLSSFFSKSTKRTNILDDIMSKRLTSAASTRWNFKSRTIETVFNNLNELLEVFTTILNDENFVHDHVTIREALGFKNILKDFTFLFLLHTFHLIFQQTDIIFNILQSRFSDITFCKNSIDNLQTTLNTLRDDKHFDEIYYKLYVCDGGPPVKKRIKDHDQMNNPRIYFKQLYNEILDLIKNQINIRFKDMELLLFIELLDKKKFDTYNNSFPQKLLNILSKNYPTIFEKTKLQTELQVWYFDPNILGISSNYTEILEYIYCNKLIDEVPEIYKLLCLVLSLPVTSVSVERSFSTLERIKNYSRNSMEQSRLNNLSTIFIERELIKHLQEKSGNKFYDKIIDNFALLQNRCIDLIYKENT